MAFVNFFDEIRKNQFGSFFMMVLFILIIGVLGAFIGYYFSSMYFGLSMAILFSIIYVLISYFAGANMILSMSGARPVTREEFPHLYHTVEGLAIAAGIPTPKAYVIDDSALNAFATGRDPKHGVICVTTGLMQKLNRQELEGVVAHEMSHIKNYDIRFMMLTAVLVGLVTLLSDFILRMFLWGGKSRDRDSGYIGLILIVVGLVFAILAPLIGQLIKLSISRKREYLADASGAMLTRYPQGLANALKKISKDPDPLVDRANKATAHLFISVPFRQKKMSLMQKMFSTHPPIAERIKRLEAM